MVHFYLGVSPLYIACHEGHIECVRLLLEAKADTEKAVEGGATPLYIATQKYYSEIIDLLLQSAANPNVMTAGQSSPLSVAVFHCNFLLVRQLLQGGAFLDASGGGETGNTVAMLAAYSLDIDVLGILVRYGASLNDVNNAGLSVDNVMRTTHGIDLLSLLLYWLTEQQNDMKRLSDNDKHDAQRIRELFDAIDSNHDQILSKKELKAALAKWGMNSKYVLCESVQNKKNVIHICLNTVIFYLMCLNVISYAVVCDWFLWRCCAGVDMVKALEHL